MVLSLLFHWGCANAQGLKEKIVSTVLLLLWNVYGGATSSKDGAKIRNKSSPLRHEPLLVFKRRLGAVLHFI